MHTNNYCCMGLTTTTLLAIALLVSGCPGPIPPVGTPDAGGLLSESFEGEWSTDVVFHVGGAPSFEYAVNMLLLVDGNELTVAGLCPGTGKLFVANGTSSTDAAWSGELRCTVYWPVCPGAEMVLSSATISLVGNVVSGSVTGRLESKCDAEPSGMEGTLSAIRSTTIPTVR